MPIRLVACDLDGTLLNSAHQIPESIRLAVRQAAQRDLRIVLATGRNRRAALPFLATLGLGQPYIVLGGGYVADPHTPQPIGHWPMTTDDAAQIAAVARSQGVTILHEEPDVMLIEGQEWAVELLRKMAGVPVERVDDILRASPNPPTKVVLIGEDARLERVAEQLARLDRPLDFAQSRTNLLDITRYGVNKGTALRHLAEHLGIPLDQVAALGDGFNDLSMFDVAGLSIAVANASPAVRERADLVAPSNDQDGAAWALAQLLA